MTEQFQDGKHGNTSVLKLTKLTLLHHLRLKRKLANLEVSKDTPVVNGTNEENNLGPSKSRDGINGSNTIGDISALEARGDVEGETVDLLNNVSKNGKLGNTSVLELSSSVLVEGLLVNSVTEAARIPESSGCDNTELVLVFTVQGSLGNSLGRRSEGGGGGGKGGGNSELHGVWIDELDLCTVQVEMATSVSFFEG